MLLTLPQTMADALSLFMDQHHIQSLQINKGCDMNEIKVEARVFSKIKVAPRSRDD